MQINCTKVHFFDKDNFTGIDFMKNIFINRIAKSIETNVRLLIFFIFFTISSSSLAAIINLTSNNTNLHKGDLFEVQLVISGLSSNIGDSLSAFDLDISFDSNVLSFTKANFSDSILGNQLDLPEATAFPFFGGAFDLGNGILDVFGISGNSSTVLDTDQFDQFRFLNLSFIAIADTNSSSIFVDLNDPNLLTLDSGFNDLNTTFRNNKLNFFVSTTKLVEPNILWLIVFCIPIFLQNKARIFLKG